MDASTTIPGSLLPRRETPRGALGRQLEIPAISDDSWCIVSTRQATFLNQGYCLERGFLAASELEAIALELHRRVEIQLDHLGLEHLGELETSASTLSRDLIRLEEARPGSQAAIYNEVNRMPSMHALAAHPRLLSIARELYGDDIAVHPRLNMIMSMPGDEWHLGVWHQDGFYGPSNHLVTYIPLQATGAHNGGIVVAPGGHTSGLLPHRENGSSAWELQSKFFTLEREVVESFPEQKQLDLGAGDLLCFDRWLPHSVSLNRSEHVRFAITIRYIDLSDPEFAGRGWQWTDQAQDGLRALASQRPQRA